MLNYGMNSMASPSGCSDEENYPRICDIFDKDNRLMQEFSSPEEVLAWVEPLLRSAQAKLASAERHAQAKDREGCEPSKEPAGSHRVASPPSGAD